MRIGSHFNAIVKKSIAILAVSCALFVSTGFAQTALAGEQMMAGGFGPYPCSAIAAGSGILNECHYSEYLKSFYEAAQKTWQFTIITGILNAFQYFNQKLATDAADFLLSGGTGKGTAFETKTFGKYLGDVAIGSANQFLSSINKFAGEEWGFNLCRPITLNLKLSLGIMKGPALPVADCTFDQVVGNFKNVYRSMQPGELTKNFRQMLQPGGNDIALTISANQKFMEKLTQANQSAILQRNENKGLKSVTDFISGRIKTPSAVALETFSTLNLMKIKKEGRQFTSGQMIGLATTAGLQQLPLIAASAFVNELATGALDKFFKFMGQAAEDSPELADLSNPDAQSSSQADGGFKAVGLTDILTPNLVSSDKQDFTFELSSCPSPRGPWGCSMDDAMMNGLHSAEKDGGNTIARAAGIGVAKQNSGAIFLHKDWELIPEWETKDSQDTGCYQRAYCATNLAKLRFARIIPIGWELAANSPFNKKNNGKYVTLETVVQNFSNCNDKGAADADHPWCHLINPGWVITAPSFICQIRGFGDTLIAPNAGERTQECTDVVSCLSSNDKGECTGGYGYCLSEKTAWRFGADSCEEKFVSCRTYQPRDKSVPLSDQNPSGGSASKSISYIRNTIDYGACSADNVGCLYYYTLRDVSTPAQDKWFMGEKTNPGDIWSSTYVTANGADSSPRVYFDGTVKKCDAANDGCTKMLAVTQNASALNLVRNSSFEEVDQKDPKKLVGWTGDYEFNAAMAENGDLVQDGTRGAIFTEKLQGAKGQVSSFMNIGGLRNYVVSFYVRKGAAAQAPVTSALVKFFKPAIDPKTKIEEMNGRNYAETATTKLGKPLIYAISPNCDKGAKAGTVSVTPAASSITGDWQRFTCEFVSPQDATAAKLTITGSNVVIDAVELEEGVAPTTYIAGVNEVLKTDYLKIAPDELRCDDTSTTTRTECGKYARMCKQTEVGCQGFTDVEGGNGIEIPATLNPRDLCPHTCVGYAEYRKLPSAFDLTKDNAPLNDPADQMVTAFIPKSAKQCSAAVAGCEEFTNIQSQATGGEQKVYLTYARACEKPGPNSATYFTWEGSDTAGYQLRTWSLMKKVENQKIDGKDVETLYPYPSVLTAPRIVLKAGPSGLVKDPATCTQETWKTGFDPDCRQFYDEKGAAFYRYFSQTVLSTPSCTDYRKNDSDIADCSKTGGVFDSKTNECVYHIEVAQSSMCTSEEASCRGYIGTTGRNTATMISESFASASSTVFYDPYKATDLKISNEALMVGDHSLLLTMKVKDQPFATAGVDFQVSTSSLYTVSFWAKSPLAGAGGKIVQLSQFYKVNEKVELGTVALSADWKRYEIGPFVMGNRFATGTVAFASSADQTYIDTVSIQRLQDIVYVRKDSWTSFAQCDQTLEGIPQPQAMLGCRSYTDRKGRVVDVREFSRLCRYETIGCSAYVNTRSSQDPYGKTFALNGIKDPNKAWDNTYAGTVTTVHPADRYEYVIDEPAARCNSEQASCRSFGQPVFDANQAVSSTQIQTVYLMDNVAQYTDEGGEPKMLCRPSELFCERYTSKPVTGAVTSYFRDPGLHVCEWKDKVPQQKGNQTMQTSGWFIKDSSPALPCYQEKQAMGNTYLFEYAGVKAYRGWTALCPQEQAECTEFRDPSDKTDQVHPLGKPYFYIDNTKIDRSSCGGKTDLFSGCVLFRNMNDSQLTISTTASYEASKKADNSAVPVVNCQTDAGNPFCKNAGTCVNVHTVKCNKQGCVDADAAIAKRLGKSCTTNADCSENEDQIAGQEYTITGDCQVNDSNLVLKVKLDRDCTTWLGCTTAETTYDPAQGKYVDLCTNMSACDQSLGATGKNFCAHYVDRSPITQKKDSLGYQEPVLNRGVFLDYLTYVKRPVGFSVPDYSSYAIPNHFQMSDLSTRRVGYELLVNRSGPQRDRYFNDYRLVASVSMYQGVTTTQGIDIKLSAKDQAAYDSDPAAAIRYTDPNNADLHLCQHKQTGRIGYYTTEAPGKCFFAIDAKYNQNAAQVLSGGPSVRDIQNIASQLGQVIDPLLDPQLSAAVPAAECRAYPDANAPFPNSYVKEWDFTLDPPRPKTFVDGYNNVPYCEKGEDCACTYRKVSYNSVTSKYYSLFGSPPPSGICSGGDRDGQACVPGATGSTPGGTIQAVGKDNKPTTATIEPHNTVASDLCGSGTCEAIQSVSFVRGQFGQCLERDFSRVVGGSQEQHPCLIWNPPPVLFGQKDAYHYQPTASYIPAQNSGEYYCVSRAKAPKNVSIDASKSWVINPGSLDFFWYDENYVSDGGQPATIGDDNTFMDNVTADGGDMGHMCEDADDQQNKGTNLYGIGIQPGINTGHYVDEKAGRWIMTGRGRTHNYAEYFLRFNDVQWTQQMYPGIQSPSPQQIGKALSERNFSFFKFSAPTNKEGGPGLMGCMRTPGWVDGVDITEYDDTQQLKDGDEKWLTYFSQNFSGVMTREAADYLMQDVETSKLLQVNCLNSDSATKGKCYYKYWQLGYRDGGEQKFTMAAARGGQAFNSQPDYQISTASKAFFSIRAMFEDTSKHDNDKSPDEITPNQLTGPFRFVGFWITATDPSASSERVIYLNLDIGSLSTCSEVAQVVASDSREATAFNDRIWEQSAFSIPLLGYRYSSTNSPFSSAVHTRPIGIDPLFQTHGKMPGLMSKLKPPGFIASGLEYSTDFHFPTGNWALLNNLFARVYRIYRYYDRAVAQGNSFCVTGPRAGNFCDQTVNGGADDCGLIGKCETWTSNDPNAPGLCNSLSGVNSGLVCTSDTNDETSGYHVCHNAPMVRDQDSGLYKPLPGTACRLVTEDGFKIAKDPQTGKPLSGMVYVPSANQELSPAQAYAYGAFRCAQGSVTINGQQPICGQGKQTEEVVENSPDCPPMVIGDGLKPDLVNEIERSPKRINDQPQKDKNGYYHSGCSIQPGDKVGRCIGFSDAYCKYDYQCEFTQIEWWGQYNAEKPWGYHVFDGDINNNAPSNPQIAGVLGALVRENHINAGHIWSSNPTVNNDLQKSRDKYMDAKYMIETIEREVGGGFSWDEGVNSANGDGFTGPLGPGGIKNSGDHRYMTYGDDLAWAGDTLSNYRSLATSGFSWWQNNLNTVYGNNDKIPSGWQYPVANGGKDIGGKDLTGGGFVRIPYGALPDYPTNLQYLATLGFDDHKMTTPGIIDRFPGAYAAAIVTELYPPNAPGNEWRLPKYSLVIPGHCEKSPMINDKVKLTKGVLELSANDQKLKALLDASVNSDQPYVDKSYYCNAETDGENAWCQYHDIFDSAGSFDEWNIYQRYFGDSSMPYITGVCDGGLREGASCTTNEECKPSNLIISVDDMKKWCRPVPTSDDEAAHDPNNDITIKDWPSQVDNKINIADMCFPKNVYVGEKDNPDLNKDDNLCTHNPGYFPRTDLCGSRIDRVQCLTGYNLLGSGKDSPRAKSVDPVESLPPTDVTPGLYQNHKLGSDLPDWTYSPVEFTYAAYYVPRPPQIAAPDTSRGCGSGQCPISKPGVFSLEGQTEGPLNYFGGQSVVTMRFYAWATDNQGAIKNMYIDWGDGTIQHIEDAKMKNKKPFCGVQSECEQVPGLTCGSDTDCPPGAGRCAPTGFCKARSYISCKSDSDCDASVKSYVAGESEKKIHDDTCVPRLTFGNSDLACEQNFFEFTHAYTCGKDMANPVFECQNESYCSRDNSVSCAKGKGCNYGDQCLTGLAKPGGCFDLKNNSCRFTPRILISDNWGWCTGECRTSVGADGKMIDSKLGTASVLYKNGGCYDAGKLYSNIDSSVKLIGTKEEDGNYCHPLTTAGSSARPWIVYPGAIELGISQ